MAEETVATPQETTNELDGIDLSLVESETPVEPTEEPVEEVIKIGDEEVPINKLQEVYKNYTNDNKWKAANDKRSTEIKEQERRLQELEQRLNDRESDLRAYEQGLYQPKEPPRTNPTNFKGLSDEELNDLDPATKAIYENLNLVTQQMQSWESRLESERFKSQLEAHHANLKSKYEDYDPLQVERSYIRGRDQMEDIYLSDKYRALLNNPTEMRKYISEEVRNEIRKEERTKLIQDIKKRQEMRSKASLPKPDKTSLGKLPEGEIKNSADLVKSAKQYLTENDISLII